MSDMPQFGAVPWTGIDRLASGFEQWTEHASCLVDRNQLVGRACATNSADSSSSAVRALQEWEQAGRLAEFVALLA